MKASCLPRILIVDHFDSYTLNLLSLLRRADDDGAEKELIAAVTDRVVILPHTHPLLSPDNFHQHVRPHIDAIILSPGPGSPENSDDFGAAEALLKDPKLDLPVLGVCLGHQGIATAFGGRIVRATSVRHGLLSKLKLVKPDKEAGKSVSRVSLLDGVPQDAEVIRYNSLVVDPETLPECLQVTAWSCDEVSPAPVPRPGKFRRQHHSPMPASSQPSPRATTPLQSVPSSPSLSNHPASSVGSLEQVSHADKSVASEASSVDEMDVRDAHDSVTRSRSAIMALQHKTLPFHGVQFHPESIESTFGHRIMSNFLSIVFGFWAARSTSGESSQAQDATDRIISWRSPSTMLPSHLVQAGQRCQAGSTPVSKPLLLASRSKPFNVAVRRFAASASDVKMVSRMPRIFDQLFRHASPIGAVWLDSAREKDPHSRYSYMAIPSFLLSYQSDSGYVVASASERLTTNLPLNTSTFWEYMDILQHDLRACTDTTASTKSKIAEGDLPDGNIFRTGFVGYWGYDMKNESLQLGVPAPREGESGFDAEFFFCNRVLAFDHHLDQWVALALTTDPDGSLTSGPIERLESTLRDFRDSVCPSARFAQSAQEAEAWFDHIAQQIDTLCREPHDIAMARDSTAIREALPVLRPKMLAEDYMEQIESSRELIAAGESYELCLTNLFSGRLPPLELDSPSGLVDLDHFDLHCKLRARNPAPYSSYLKLPTFENTKTRNVNEPRRGRAIVSTSPERFMRITRDGKVEMKPIKGTCARAGFGPGEESMRPGHGSHEEEEIKRKWREAEDERRRAKLAADVKERAENLMIVDLIRADLFSFCRLDSVSVPSLMKIESYETVHQLVTTVVGELKSNIGTTEAIRRCFPPGSMTGAPKRRSVQLLERLELNLTDAQRDDQLRSRRGIYSGIIGWMGLDGAADFSVVIRTLVADGDAISIGAGGGLTYLSDPQMEWQEALDKVNALARVDLSEPAPSSLLT